LALEGKYKVAQYKHHIGIFGKSRRAHKIKRAAQITVVLLIIIISYVGVDWVLSNLNSAKTVIGKDSSATVQAAQINFFRTPYFQFQVDSSWREVTSELNLSNDGNTRQYLYRSFNKNFIDHELWITVNLPEDYSLERHNVPTRVMPVRIESEGTLTQIGEISNPCIEVEPKEKPNLDPHVVSQSGVEYYCNPNQVNDYIVTVGVPSGTNKLPMPHVEGMLASKSTIGITYRNTTPIPNSSVFERFVRDFKSL
jgi:hypothetical protein